MEPLDALARGVTLFLGGLTQASYKFFESIGADMSGVDETLAAWTTWSQNIQAQLATALETNAQLVATDAEQDAAQAAALQEQFAAQVQAAYELATTSPAPPVEEPPVEEPPVEEPPVDETPEEPVEEPPVEEPGDGEVPPEEPVVNPL